MMSTMREAITLASASFRCRLRRDAGLSRSILREDVVFVLHQRVAAKPAFRVVLLRRFVCRRSRPKRRRRSVILKRGPSPPAAIRKPLAILHHEIDVMLSARHHWLTGV